MEGGEGAWLDERGGLRVAPCRLPPSPPRASPPLRAASRGRAEAGAAPGGRRGWGGPCKLGVCGGERGEGAPSWPFGSSGCGPLPCPQQNFEPVAGGRRCGRLGGRVGVAEPCMENGLWAACPACFEPGGCEEKEERGGLFAVHPPFPCEQPRGQTGLGLGGVPWDSPRRGQLKRDTSFALPNTKISFSFSCQICHFHTESWY